MAVKATASNKDIISYLINTPDSGFYKAFSNNDLLKIENVYDQLLSNNYQPKRNQFLQSLYGVLGWSSVDNAIFNNPLGFLKKAPMRYGQYDRETYVNMLKSKDYDFYADEKSLLKIYESYVMTCYHELKFKKEWALTIAYDELRDSFAEPFGLQSLINSKLAVVPASVEYWEYRAILNLCNVGYAKQFFYPVTVQNPINETTAKQLLKLIKAYTRKASFPNPAFNLAGAESPVQVNNLLLIVTPEVEASLDVDGLAVLFHIDKAEVAARVVVVDKFDNPAIVALLVDRRFFRWRDQIHQMGSIWNPDALRTNFFYHAWELISASPFYTVIAFTTDSVTVNGIVVPNNLTFVPGEQLEIPITISGVADTYNPQGYIAKITSAVTGNTTMIVPGTNVLIVDHEETATQIVVEIKSTYNENVKTSVTINAANRNIIETE